MENITKANFDAVNNGEKPLLIDFWATWCGPCKMIAPVVEKVAAERSDIVVAKCDVDSEPELANRFGIEVIPTLVMVKGDEVLGKAMGYKDHGGLTAFIDGAIK